MDRGSGHRPRGTDAGHFGGSVRPLFLTSRRFSGNESNRGNAQSVRRSCRASRRVDMYVARLALQDFRSWSELELPLEPGPTAFVRPTGHGNTSRAAAVAYVATLASHRGPHDGPLVRGAADQASVRTEAIRDGRSALLEVEINPGKSNRARINRSPLARAREM